MEFDFDPGSLVGSLCRAAIEGHPEVVTQIFSQLDIQTSIQLLQAQSPVKINQSINLLFLILN
jgi:hypothetical protein